MKQKLFLKIILLTQLFQTSLSLCSWGEQFKGICKEFYHGAKDTIKDNSNNIAAVILTGAPVLILSTIAKKSSNRKNKNQEQVSFIQNNINKSPETTQRDNILQQSLLQSNINNNIASIPPIKSPEKHIQKENNQSPQSKDLIATNTSNTNNQMALQKQEELSKNEEQINLLQKDMRLKFDEIKLKNPLIQRIELQLKKENSTVEKFDKMILCLSKISKDLETLKINNINIDNNKKYFNAPVNEYKKVTLDETDKQEIATALTRQNINDENIKNICIDYYQKKIPSDVKKQYTEALILLLDELPIVNYLFQDNIKLSDIMFAHKAIKNKMDLAALCFEKNTNNAIQNIENPELKDLVKKYDPQMQKQNNTKLDDNEINILFQKIFSEKDSEKEMEEYNKQNKKPTLPDILQKVQGLCSDEKDILIVQKKALAVYKKQLAQSMIQKIGLKRIENIDLCPNVLKINELYNDFIEESSRIKYKENLNFMLNKINTNIVIIDNNKEYTKISAESIINNNFQKIQTSNNQKDFKNAYIMLTGQPIDKALEETAFKQNQACNEKLNTLGVNNIVENYNYIDTIIKTIQDAFDKNVLGTEIATNLQNIYFVQLRNRAYEDLKKYDVDYSTVVKDKDYLSIFATIKQYYGQYGNDNAQLINNIPDLRKNLGKILLENNNNDDFLRENSFIEPFIRTVYHNQLNEHKKNNNLTIKCQNFIDQYNKLYNLYKGGMQRNIEDYLIPITNINDIFNVSQEITKNLNGVEALKPENYEKYHRNILEKKIIEHYDSKNGIITNNKKLNNNIKSFIFTNEIKNIESDIIKYIKGHHHFDIKVDKYNNVIDNHDMVKTLQTIKSFFDKHKTPNDILQNAHLLNTCGDTQSMRQHYSKQFINELEDLATKNFILNNGFQDDPLQGKNHYLVTKNIMLLFEENMNEMQNIYNPCTLLDTYNHLITKTKLLLEQLKNENYSVDKIIQAKYIHNDIIAPYEKELLTKTQDYYKKTFGITDQFNTINDAYVIQKLFDIFFDKIGKNININNFDINNPNHLETVYKGLYEQENNGFSYIESTMNEILYGIFSYSTTFSNNFLQQTYKSKDINNHFKCTNNDNKKQAMKPFINFMKQHIEELLLNTFTKAVKTFIENENKNQIDNQKNPKCNVLTIKNIYYATEEIKETFDIKKIENQTNEIWDLISTYDNLKKEKVQEIQKKYDLKFDYALAERPEIKNIMTVYENALLLKFKQYFKDTFSIDNIESFADARAIHELFDIFFEKCTQESNNAGYFKKNPKTKQQIIKDTQYIIEKIGFIKSAMSTVANKESHQSTSKYFSKNYAPHNQQDTFYSNWKWDVDRNSAQEKFMKAIKAGFQKQLDTHNKKNNH